MTNKEMLGVIYQALNDVTELNIEGNITKNTLDIVLGDILVLVNFYSRVVSEDYGSISESDIRKVFKELSLEIREVI